VDASGLLGDGVDCVLAAVERGDGDASEWDSGDDVEYCAELSGEFEPELYCDWKCGDCGWKFFGSECGWCEWNSGWSMDPGGLQLSTPSSFEKD
jgi:hypothetical protein